MLKVKDSHKGWVVDIQYREYHSSYSAFCGSIDLSEYDCLYVYKEKTNGLFDIFVVLRSNRLVLENKMVAGRLSSHQVEEVE